ncbi:glycosyltransferase family 4 protein [Bacillus sp. NTK071]|uniref:glycosyltransferase family 4 protein n=1 Tax=Bacillus sp. NTK071 TaxID=2802175 RepID=UPI001A8DCADE|nr:glycosyltransferase family 4 protein [Bacillus sp. NTK071]MBN8210712.1 glycosyltransferase family 4 protein [Bacillus sp. NTK071]
MKILYIYRYLLLGGVTTQLANRLGFLRDVSDPHFIFLSDHGGRTAFKDYDKLKVLSDPAPIYEYISEQQFDLIIAIDTKEITDYLIEKQCQTPIIQEVHGISYKLNYLVEEDSSDFQGYIVPSSFSKERIIVDYHAPEEKTYVIPNCLDTTLFTPKQTELITNKKIICWVGKLNDHKNWIGFLDLAEKLAHNRDDCVFWIVGGETASMKATKHFFEEVNNRNVSINWIDRMEYSEMPELYSMVAQSGGCTVSTSKGESFGMSLIEAMACGCPAVAPSVGAIPEIYTETLERLTYELHDISSCAAIVSRLLDDPNERSEQIKNGMTKVRANYSIDRVVSRYYELLQKLTKTQEIW